LSLVLTPAEALLWSYGITEPRQIDLDAIATDQHATVRYRILEGCEARLVAGGAQAVISINTRGSTLGRQRFSLAHELAHWLCDKRAGSFLCAKTDIGPQNSEAKSFESHANAYASQLVLPTYLVDPWLAGRVASLATARALAAEFRSSVTAAAIKLIKRTPQIAIVARHGEGRLIWHQRSPSMPSAFYVLPELHQQTDAFTLSFGGAVADRPRKEPANRWISGPDVVRLEALSQSVRLPDGTVLSLIDFGK
jgi:IrrE N-terminal-like domain